LDLALAFGLAAFGFTPSTIEVNEAKASRVAFCFAEVGLNMKLFTAFLVAFSNSEWEMVFAISLRD
jgi:hypothetical protein